MRIVSAEHIASLGKMKQLSELLNTEFGNSLTAKRAQVRNEILVRGDEIQAELAKGWSAARHRKGLSQKQGNNMQLQCAPFAAAIGDDTNQGDHAKKTKRIHLGSNTKPRRIDWLTSAYEYCSPNFAR